MFRNKAEFADRRGIGLVAILAKDSDQKLTFAQPRLGAALISCAFALILALFTHVVSCVPCYDDDVCASARIEGTFLQTLKAETLDVGNAADDGAAKVLVRTALETAALLVVLPEAADVQTGRSLSETLPRNSALAHRRTVVLVI